MPRRNARFALILMITTLIMILVWWLDLPFLVAWLSWVVVLALAYFEPPIFQPVMEKNKRSAQPPVNSQLRKRLNEFSGIISTPFMLVDADGRVVMRNAHHQELFAYLQKGDHFSQLARSSTYLTAMQSAIKGQAVAPFVFQTHRQHQKTFEVTVHNLPASLMNLTGARLMVEMHDRTEILNSEVMLRDFIANASHELRTPLSAIQGGIETIEAHPDDPAARAQFLPIMRHETERMQRLVQDLMNLSQIERDEHLPPTDRVDLAAVIAECLQILAPLITKNDIQIRNQMVECWVIGDFDQLKQVFVNLIDNAIKYGKQGGVVTLARAKPSPVYPHQMGVSIVDQGVGIPNVEIPKLTQRFYRVSNQDSRDQGGTGLGLAIVKHILRRHQGELQIRSQLGVGSEITVWLPESQNIND